MTVYEALQLMLASASFVVTLVSLIVVLINSYNKK